MKKLIISLVILSVILSSVPFKVAADSGTLTAKEALKILQSINPNIANYDIETHLVVFKDGSKAVYVTPKGEHSQNGEVTWEYFVQQKGDLRGWFKLAPEKILSEKSRMLKESNSECCYSAYDCKFWICFTYTISTRKVCMVWSCFNTISIIRVEQVYSTIYYSSKGVRL